MHTGTLLRRLERLRKMPDAHDPLYSDWEPEELEAVEQSDLIAFKQTDRWQEEFAKTKALLAKREHLPRGSKKKRQEDARRKQNR